MKYIKSIFVKADGTIVYEDKQYSSASKSDIIRFDPWTAYAFATIQHLLSVAFFKADRLFVEYDVEDPLVVSVCHQGDSKHKRKVNDSETSHEVIEWFITNMEPPTGGIKFQIFEADQSKSYPNLNTPFAYNIFWPLRQKWLDKDESGYVVVHEVESKVKVSYRSNLNKAFDTVKSWAIAVGLDIKYVDYTMKMDDIIELYINSYAVFTYRGASGFLAPSTHTPTVVIMNVPFFYTPDAQGIRVPSIIDSNLIQRVDGVLFTKHPPIRTTMINNNVGVVDIQCLMETRHIWTDPDHRDHMLQVYHNILRNTQ
jgi:hypothetical protein